MTFSIRYDGSEKEIHSYTEYAVDWDWKVKGEWAMSEKEGFCGKWITTPGIDNRAYNAILKHFGLDELENFQKYFPLEKIITMSWENLGKIRRNLEKKYNLPCKKIKSNTLGDDSKVV